MDMATCSEQAVIITLLHVGNKPDVRSSKGCVSAPALGI